MEEKRYIIAGRNAARETILSGNAKSVLIKENLQGDPVVRLAKEKGIPVLFRSDFELTRLCGTSHHQGIAVEAKPYEYYDLSSIIASASVKKDSTVLILDGIEDPNNLGAILRSCDAFGVDGVVIKSRGEVGLTPTVAKVSTGAISYVKVACVPNLSQAISELKDAGYWVVSSDGSAKMSYEDVDYSGKIALVVGSEGFGISKLVLSRSDFVVKIPMVGHVNSLNASVAAGILIAHISHKRS
jgi:23S rRNA (guanosine2251-2'-O)-methyltransferase